MPELADLLDCAGARWSPTIGDPTIWGWATVAAYGLAALLSLVAARHKDRRERGFWLLVAALMAALCVNKQLDLQSALTATGRCLAQAQGWYEERRAVQAEFVLALLALCAAAGVLVLVLMRRHLVRLSVAILGLALVVSFVAVRAVGLHHVDALINMDVAGIRANPLLELPGIGLVAANALARIRPARAHRRTPARRSGAR